jgi:ribosomal protein L31
MYCSNRLDIKRWKSDFSNHKHYKINKCESCGKESRVDVDYHGSGHEEWTGETSFLNASESIERILRSERRRVWQK